MTCAVVSRKCSSETPKNSAEGTSSSLLARTLRPFRDRSPRGLPYLDVLIPQAGVLDHLGEPLRIEVLARLVDVGDGHPGPRRLGPRLEIANEDRNGGV